MKYTCEVCGKSFFSMNECAGHETKCRKMHDDAFKIRDTMRSLIEKANATGVSFGLSGTADEEQCQFTAAEYDAEKNAVIVHLSCE